MTTLAQAWTNPRTRCRLGALLAYAMFVPIFVIAELSLEYLQNAKCVHDATSYWIEFPTRNTVIALIALAVPVLLARSNSLIGFNLWTASLTAFVTLVIAASNFSNPIACYTTGRSAYDRISSFTTHFEVVFLVVSVLSYSFLIVDLLICGLEKLIRIVKRRGFSVLESD